jgi:CBS domain containing-hemolysin-like protein
MEAWLIQSLLIVATLALVLLNSFFVAAEFALVKVRGSKLAEMAREEKPFAKTAQWMAWRLDRSLSACQLGITMASLGLGWIGEPAIARLLNPLFIAVGITSPALLHALAFAIAFTFITAVHLVIGEQAPKIYAIRRPGRTARWCSLPLKWFYFLTYPLLMGLNASTTFILRRVGIEGVSEHDIPHSEQEIRALLSQAHAHGELTRSEHRLLDAVFEFDDTVALQIMVPRLDVEFFDVNRPFAEAMEKARRSKHTRYPLCDGSMDNILGFIHTKDLLHVSDAESFDLRSVCRPPRYIPERMPLSSLLNLFRGSRQHLAFVVDEYGSVVGIVTLENVLEQIVGQLQDEFDDEGPQIVPEGSGVFIVHGGAHVDDVNKVLKTGFSAPGVETMAGLVTAQLGRIAEAGDRVELEGALAEVLEVRRSRAIRIRVTISQREAEEEYS